MITVNDRQDFVIKCDYQLRTRCNAVEIGVLKGEFSQYIFNIIDPDLLVLIDPFQKNGKCYNEGLGFLPSAYSTDEDYEHVCKKFFYDIKRGKVIIDRDYSYQTACTYPNIFFDFIYIDGSHLYEDVKRDLNDWLPKLTAKGLMCGHDYIQHESFGVIQAVDEFCKEHNFEMIIFNENGGDYALRAIQ